MGRRGFSAYMPRRISVRGWLFSYFQGPSLQNGIVEISLSLEISIQFLIVERGRGVMVLLLSPMIWLILRSCWVYKTFSLPTRATPSMLTANPCFKAGLDRFMVSSETGMWCHNVIQKAVFHICSDHIPIVLSGGQFFTGPKTFKFFNT